MMTTTILLLVILVLNAHEKGKATMKEHGESVVMVRVKRRASGHGRVLRPALFQVSIFFHLKLNT